MNISVDRDFLEHLLHQLVTTDKLYATDKVRPREEDLFQIDNTEYIEKLKEILPQGSYALSQK